MSHFNKLFSLTVGLSVQILSMFLRIFLPAAASLGGGVGSAVLGGFGLCRPFLDALMAEASPETERSGIYASKMC